MQLGSQKTQHEHPKDDEVVDVVAQKGHAGVDPRLGGVPERPKTKAQRGRRALSRASVGHRAGPSKVKGRLVVSRRPVDEDHQARELGEDQAGERGGPIGQGHTPRHAQFSRCRTAQPLLEGRLRKGRSKRQAAVSRDLLAKKMAEERARWSQIGAANSGGGAQGALCHPKS